MRFVVASAAALLLLSLVPGVAADESDAAEGSDMSPVFCNPTYYGCEYCVHSSWNPQEGFTGTAACVPGTSPVPVCIPVGQGEICL